MVTLIMNVGDMCKGHCGWNKSFQSLNGVQKVVDRPNFDVSIIRLWTVVHTEYGTRLVHCSQIYNFIYLGNVKRLKVTYAIDN